MYMSENVRNRKVSGAPTPSAYLFDFQSQLLLLNALIQGLIFVFVSPKRS